MTDTKKKTFANFISTSLMVTAFAVVVGLLYDYYYDINDDVLMKDILAGVYTGTPEGHNIQMLYPVSLFISSAYHIVRSVDWYGIFLLICQYGSIVIILNYISETFSLEAGNPVEKNISAGILCRAMGLITISALMLGHLMFVQYTFSVAILCSAAAILFAENRNKTAIVIVILAYLIRSEMTLLMIPFVGLVLFYKFVDETDRKSAIRKYIVILLCTAACLMVSEGLHFAGYSSQGWREFVSFFDSRTRIYDFYQIPDYSEHKEFYDSINLDKSEYELLVNYNFGLDDEINADLMKKIADYAGSVTKQEGIVTRLKAVLPKYTYRLRAVSFPKSYEYPMTDAPWNIVTGILYLAVFLLFLTGFGGKGEMKRGFIEGAWRLALLFLGRTSIWLYIMVRGRDPIRITHSLYLIEIMVLLSLINGALKRKNFGSEGLNYNKSTCRKIMTICGAVISLCALIYLPVQSNITKTECSGRAEYNKVYEQLEDYFRKNSDHFYLVDVYSSVSYKDEGYAFSQKMFENVNNNPRNWIYMGGWACKSPIEKRTLEEFFGDDSMENALCEENAFVVARLDTDMEWLSDYCNDKGYDITITKTDEIADSFAIYSVRK